MGKVAFITGVTGQTASYLVELLLSKGYTVHGLKRRTSLINTERIDQVYIDPHQPGKFRMHYGDMTDGASLFRLITELKPDEVYNLAAMSHVKVSFEIPEYTADVVAMGTLRLLEAIRNSGRMDKIKYYQAGSSEAFGKVLETPQTEKTPFYPRSPYAVAKVFAHQLTVNYRESYGLFGCNGQLFNHESPRRGETFVTRKITIAAAKIALGKESQVWLGNLDAKRDWGHAKDYVRAMWLIMQQELPDDYVIATGVTTSVRNFATMAFKEAGIEIEFSGEGLNEIAIDKATGKTVIKIDPRYYRPAEVDLLLGDASKAKDQLGWEPEYTLADIVKEMVQSDLKLYEKK
jgi:GDPmannose 4,6-dehydratase